MGGLINSINKKCTGWVCGKTRKGMCVCPTHRYPENVLKWMKRSRRDLYDYCKLHYLQHIKIFDEGEFNKFKKENFLKAI